MLAYFQPFDSNIAWWFVCIWLVRVRVHYRHTDDRDGPEPVSTDGEAVAELRLYDRLLTVSLAIAAAVVIAAIVTVALEPDSDLQVAAAGVGTQTQPGPCENQTWPHFSAACIASKAARRP